MKTKLITIQKSVSSSLLIRKALSPMLFLGLLAIVLQGCDSGIVDQGTAYINNKDSSPVSSSSKVSELPKNARSAVHVSALSIGETMIGNMEKNLSAFGLTNAQTQVIISSSREKLKTTVSQLIIPDSSTGLQLAAEDSSNSYKPVFIAGPAVIEGMMTSMAKPEAGLASGEAKSNVAKLGLSSSFESLKGQTSDLSQQGVGDLAKVMVGTAVQNIAESGMETQDAGKGISAITTGAISALGSAGLESETIMVAAQSVVEGAIEEIASAIDANDAAASSLIQDAISQATSAAVTQVTNLSTAVSSANSDVGEMAGRLAASSLKGVKQLQDRLTQTAPAAAAAALDLDSAIKEVSKTAVTAMQNVAAASSSDAAMSKSLSSLTKGMVGSLASAGFAKDDIASRAGAITSGAIVSLASSAKANSSDLMKEVMTSAVSNLSKNNLSPLEVAGSMSAMMKKTVSEMSSVTSADTTAKSSMISNVLTGAVSAFQNSGMNDASVMQVALAGASQGATESLASAGIAAADISSVSSSIAKTSITLVSSMEMTVSGTKDTTANSFQNIAASINQGIMAGIGKMQASGKIDAAIVSQAANSVVDQSIAAIKTISASNGPLNIAASDMANMSNNLVSGAFQGLAIGGIASASITSMQTAIVQTVQTSLQNVISADALSSLSTQISSTVTQATTLASNISQAATAYGLCVEKYPNTFSQDQFLAAIGTAVASSIFCIENKLIPCPMPRFTPGGDYSWIISPAPLADINQKLCQLTMVPKSTSSSTTGTIEVPGSFSLMNPVASFTTSDPSFSWSVSSGAIGYELIISKNDTCTDMIRFEKLPLVQSYQASLLNDGTYYLCMRSVNSFARFTPVTGGIFKFTVSKTSTATSSTTTTNTSTTTSPIILTSPTTTTSTTTTSTSTTTTNTTSTTLGDNTITTATDPAAYCHSLNRYWYNGICNISPITCSFDSGFKPSASGEYCMMLSFSEATTVSSCQGIAGYWYDSKCNSAPSTAISCPSGQVPDSTGTYCVTSSSTQTTTIATAMNVTDCHTVAGYWYENSCHETPGIICTNAAQTVAYSSPISQITCSPKDTTITGSASYSFNGCGSSLYLNSYSNSLSATIDGNMPIFSCQSLVKLMHNGFSSSMMIDLRVVYNGIYFEMAPFGTDYFSSPTPQVTDYAFASANSTIWRASKFGLQSSTVSVPASYSWSKAIGTPHLPSAQVNAVLSDDTGSTVFALTPAGFAYTTNSGASWNKFPSLMNAGVRVCNTSDLTVYMTYASGTSMIKKFQNNTFTTLGDNGIGYTSIDAMDDNCFNASTTDHVIIVGSPTSVKASLDGGTSWYSSATPPTAVYSVGVLKYNNYTYFLRGRNDVIEIAQNNVVSTWSSVKTIAGGGIPRIKVAANVIYASFANDSNVYVSSDAGATWTAYIDAGGQAFAVAGNRYISEKNNIIRYTNDYLATFTTIQNTSMPDALDIVAVASNGSYVFAGSPIGFYRSTDSVGSYWSSTKKTTADGLAANAIHSIYTRDDNYSGYVYVTHPGAGASYSANNGDSFISLSNVPNAAGVTSIFGDYSKIFIGTNNGLAITQDGGTNWSVINTSVNGFPGNNVKAVFGAINTNYTLSHIFAATDMGLGISDDGGNTWVSYTITNGIPGTSNDIRDVKAYCTGDNKYVVYFLTGSGLMKGDYNGTSWSWVQLSTNLAQKLFVKGRTILMGDDLKTYISNDDGVTWLRPYSVLNSINLTSTTDYWNDALATEAGFPGPAKRQNLWMNSQYIFSSSSGGLVRSKVILPPPP